ncbi:uncharacterized protein LOC123540492 [Mercenaria mercenaria]|uniref:uncharacterized protein LOC123540492 n=1 Tax=Mercenaria mercenaria TaxID=6596 RepID=UPI00234EC067|nr:uncharacterized protein LOC123540492 [Mercenaria mercenaria]
MIGVRSFLGPPECFAPYCYLSKYIFDINQRYAELAKILGFSDSLETPKFGWLNIHICEQQKCMKSLDITDVISRKGYKSIDVKGQINHKNLGTFLERNETLKSTNVSLVLINNSLELLSEVNALKSTEKDILFIIILDKTNEKQSISKCQTEERSSGNVLITSRENVNDDIGDMLERIVLKTMKTKCENVYKWLNEMKSSVVNKLTTDGSRKRKSFDEARCKIKMMCTHRLTSHDKENDSMCQHFYTPTGIDDHVSSNDRNINDKNKVCPQTGVEENSIAKRTDSRSSSTSTSYRQECIDRDTIESLLGEMVALFSNSKVPHYERPNLPQYEEKEIIEELRTELLDISPSIRGVGFRFTCFVVYVERTGTKRLLRKIRSVLRKYQIDDYEIQTVSEQRDYCRVGAKIRAARRCKDQSKPVEGTLGCFAKNTDGKDTNMYALISKHVAQFCDSFKISSTSASDILCKVIERSVTQTGLDIAALWLDLNDKSIKICARYKTEMIDDESASGSAEGNDGSDLLQGKLHHYSDQLKCGQSDIVCNGQKVYIWGAVSKPGKGVITMRAFKSGEMKALIQVEDRVPSMVGEVPERFCCSGDSGAIVCAEDRRGKCVHILAMVMGIANEKEIKENPKLRGRYLTVPLSSGLEELQDRTGHIFQICECIDS